MGATSRSFAVGLLVALATQMLPLRTGLPATDAEVDQASLDVRSAGAVYKQFAPLLDIRTAHESSPFPLVISPGETGDASVTSIAEWVRENAEWLTEAFYRHGAVVFRGFNVTSARDFEIIAECAVLPSTLFDGIYLGTSPRLPAVDGTRYIYTASEIPGWQHITAHLEMSFRSVGMPQKILFWGETPNESEGGETPLVDFLQVWKEMRPEVAQRFVERGLRYNRQYFSDQKGGRNSVFPFSHHPSFAKSWEKMFHTEEKAVAAKRAVEQGFEPTWLHGDADMLRLSHSMNATRVHPITGQTFWGNHLGVIHASMWVDEFAAAFHRPNMSSRWRLRAASSYAYMKVWGAITQAFLGHAGIGMQATHADGGRIADEDVAHVRQLIWRNSFVAKWQKGDIAFLDNNRIAHGRQAFSGPRRVLVSWAE